MKSKIALSLIAIAAVASPVAAFAKHERADKADRHAVHHAHGAATQAAAPTTARHMPTVSATTAPAVTAKPPAKPK